MVGSQKKKFQFCGVAKTFHIHFVEDSSDNCAKPALMYVGSRFIASVASVIAIPANFHITRISKMNYQEPK
jgi:hypothetical protein